MGKVDNLKITNEEARRRGRLGGIKKGENIKFKKSFKMALDWYLEQKFEPETDEEKVLMERFPDLTQRDAIAIAVSGKAMQGDVRAALFVRDTVGEMPILNVAVEQGEPFEITIKTVE